MASSVASVASSVASKPPESQAAASAAANSAASIIPSLGLASRAYSRGARLYTTVLEVLTPRGTAARQERAVGIIQLAARRWLARRKRLHPWTEQETEACIKIQGASCDPHSVSSYHRSRCCAAIFFRMNASRFSSSRVCTAITKGQLQRAHTREDERWLAEAEQASLAAERARLMSECSAVLEKRGRRRLSLGPFELVLWHERLVSASETGLTYCRFCADLTPKGEPTEIPYASMTMIKALSGNFLQICDTARRSHLFQLSSREESERWAINLVALAATAGYAVPGCIVAVDSGTSSPAMHAAAAGLDLEDGAEPEDEKI